MFIHRKIVLSVFLIQFAASAALANHLETSPAGSQSPRKWSAYPHHIQNRGKAIVSNSYVDWEAISGSAVWPPQSPLPAPGWKATRTATRMTYINAISNRLASILLLVLRGANSGRRQRNESAA